MRSESSTSGNGGGGPSNRASAPTCMCELEPSWARNDASSAVRRSKCCCAMVGQPYSRPAFFTGDHRFVPSSFRVCANTAAPGGSAGGRAYPRSMRSAPADTIESEALELLRELAGPQAEFREHQLEAVADLVVGSRRVLCVQ